MERVYRTPGGSFIFIYRATMTLHEAIQTALAADHAYETAVHAAGYKSRWDVPAKTKLSNLALYDAYLTKLAADRAMHDAFERSREQNRSEG